MKLSFFPLLMVASLYAQTPSPKAPAPPGIAPLAATATPAPETPPDKIVAKIDGKEYTAGEVKKILDEFPPQVRDAFSKNPVKTLNYIFMLKHLAHQAEFEGLDKKPQFEQDFEFSRLTMLSQAELNNYRNSYRPAPEEEKAYYDKRADNYQEAKVKVIYISFVANPPKDNPKARTEEQAKAKIEEIRKQVADGGDFGKLAADNSEDKASAAKGGDFGSITRTSGYPENIKTAVFALKEGEVSQPVRQPNGFYLLKLEKLEAHPFTEVESKIHSQLQQEHFQEWVKSIETRYTVNVEDPQFFAVRAPR